MGQGLALPVPTPAQVRWQNFELGLVFHLDLPVFAPGGWRELKATLDPNLYNPARLDTGQWAEAAKAMGCRYAIFTATHFNGFLQWQSDLYPYGLKQTRWRGGKADVFGDFVASCRKNGTRRFRSGSNRVADTGGRAYSSPVSRSAWKLH